MNKQNENKRIEADNRLVVTGEKGEGGRAERVKGLNCMVMDRN